MAFRRASSMQPRSCSFSAVIPETSANECDGIGLNQLSTVSSLGPLADFFPLFSCLLLEDAEPSRLSPRFLLSFSCRMR